MGRTRRTARRRLVWWTAGVGGIAALSLAAIGQAVGLFSGTSTAAVAFTRALSDEEFAELLRRHELAPRAASMHVGRLTGTDRAHGDERRRSLFIGSLRARASEQFRRGLEGNLFRLRRFLSLYTRDEVVTSARLARDGSGLLAIRCELEEALTRTARGDPIIIGAEVSGTPSALDALKDDPRVAAFRSTSKWRTVPLPLDVPRPPARSACAKRLLPGAEVYRRIRKIVG